MAESTGIGWCDATFNPWIGCEKVSPGCMFWMCRAITAEQASRLRDWAFAEIERANPDVPG
jgi:protein gp37